MREKGIPIEDERDDPDVEHAAAEPHAETEQEHMLHIRTESARELSAQHGYGLCSDDRDQPAPVDPVGQPRLLGFHREHREDAVGDHRPQQQAEGPQRCRGRPRTRDQQDLIAQHARRSHGREEPDRATVVDDVGCHTFGEASDADAREDPQGSVEDDVGPQQGNRQTRQAERLCGDGHDAGGHHQGKGCGVHRRQPGRRRRRSPRDDVTAHGRRAVEVVEVAQQADVQQQAEQAGGCRRPDDRVVASQIGVHRRRRAARAATRRASARTPASPESRSCVAGA